MSKHDNSSSDDDRNATNKSSPSSSSKSINNEEDAYVVSVGYEEKKNLKQSPYQNNIKEPLDDTEDEDLATKLTSKKIDFLSRPCPYDSASLISKYITFYWIAPLLKIGLKRNLDIDDLFGNAKEDDSTDLGAQLQLDWYKEVHLAKKSASGSNGRKPNLLRVFLRQHTFWFLMSWLWLLLSHCIVSPIQAIILGQLIEDVTQYYTLINSGDQSALNELYWRIFIEGLLVIVATLIVSITIHPYFFCVQHLGMKLRVASCSLIFQKSLRLSKAAMSNTTVGQIVNLISNDVNRFDFGLVFIPYLIVAPLQAVIIVILLSQYYLGLVPTLAGFSVFLLYLPFQAFMGKWFGTIREKTAFHTDERIRLMNEIIPAMRVIKMYAWEKSFAKLVDIARRREVKWIRYRVILTSINEALYFISAKLIILICLITFVLMGYQLTAEAAFVTITLLESLRLNMTFFFPFAVASIAELVVSCNRLETFLLLGEQPKESKIKYLNTSQSRQQRPPASKPDERLISLDDGPLGEAAGTGKTDKPEKFDGEPLGIEAHEISAAWIADDLYERSNETALSLSGLNFIVRPGELLVIVGRVGSGKSSILMTLLGELPIVSGDLIIDGKISYASQEAWIFAGTVRENILFGKEYDPVKFEEVLRVCALNKDIELFPQGDKTLVGERGISLSGGQKARVNLARALYLDADIYLLDDPLSAVDASVAKHIFENCIKDYLKTKTVVLVTHQLQFAKGASKILVVDSGHQLALGMYKDLSKQVDLIGFNKGLNRSESESEQTPASATGGGGQSALQSSTASSGQAGVGVTAFQHSGSPAKKGMTTSINTPSTKHSANQIVQAAATDDGINQEQKFRNLDEIRGEAPVRKMTKETMDAETVGCASYLFYLVCVSSIILLIFVFVSNIVAQVLFNGSDFYLSYWTDTEERRSMSMVANGGNGTFTPITLTDQLSLAQNSYVYAIVILLLFVAVLIRTTTFFVACMRASVNMHNKLFGSVIDAPISFFDFNPIGILLNRISRDMGIVDDRLPQNAFDVFEIFTSTLGIVATVIVVDYINVIPALALILIALVARRVCLRTINRLKEMEGILRSQVFSHLSTTLSGLTTIRSFKVQQQFIKKFDLAQDEHSVAWLAFFTSGQWLGITLDMICMVFISFVIIVLTTTIETSLLNGSKLGLAISSALVIVGPFQWGIRQLVELESHMTSVKRIKEYSFLPKEASHDSKPGKKPPPEWPQKGNIVFDNVSLSYFEDEEPVLKNLNFEIKQKEKIGIVGRTGAGKSSIIAALFRMTEPKGTIVIDNISIDTIGLNDLRRAISIIPQEPILFNGPVRRNLDPFEEYSDQAIWSSLESVQLKKVILGLDGGLDAKVSEGGQNFSVGQRQLICLARAILRRSRILVLDEATANVDPETDQFIQKTIRELFRHCTVITIAHRLNTIMDSDRVLVLDSGEVREFDEPHILLTKGGYLATMTANTGPAADRLRKMAERNYKRKHNSSNV